MRASFSLTDVFGTKGRLEVFASLAAIAGAAAGAGRTNIQLNENSPRDGNEDRADGKRDVRV
jgi:hypothetical protein